MDLITSDPTPIPSSAPPPPSPSSASPAALPPPSSEIGKPVILIFTPQKILVMEDFSCPFCLVKCTSYKGLRLHLPSSHDLFNFEFWANEEYQAVNVSVNTDQWRSEIVADGVDPKLQTFFIWEVDVEEGKYKKPKRKSQYSSCSEAGL